MSFNSVFVLDNFRASASRATYSLSPDKKCAEWNHTATQVYIGLHKAAYTKSLNTEFKNIAAGMAVNALFSMIPGSHILVQLAKEVAQEAGNAVISQLTLGGTMVTLEPSRQIVQDLSELTRYTNTGDSVTLKGTIMAGGVPGNYTIMAVATGGPENPAAAVRQCRPQVVSIAAVFSVKKGSLEEASYMVQSKGQYVKIPSGSWFGG